MVSDAMSILTLFQEATGYTESSEAYGTIREAENYFQGVIFKDSWLNASPEEKKVALIAGTRCLKNLPFLSTVIPNNVLNIRWASYECALALLNGVDPEAESQNMMLVEQLQGGNRNYYNRSDFPDYIRYGVPSVTAWRLVKPYLVDEREMDLVRA